MKSKKMRLTFLVLILGLTAGLWRVLPPAPSLFAQRLEADHKQIDLFTEILTHIQEHYVEPVETKSLIYGAAQGMVKTLDPFSQFMEPKTNKEMRVETEGRFGGLGIRIAIQDEWLTVMSPIVGTPAWRLGIIPEDRIVKIEGESTYGITTEQAVEKLRGDPGTRVTITISREGVKEPMDFTVTREEIKIYSVKSKMLAENIGYLRIIEFNAQTSQDVSRGLVELSEKGMKSLVLDLRNNPGGLLNSAVNVSKNFIGDGKMIVYTKGRTEKRMDYLADGPAPYGETPLVVLINRGSASGSEIVAGALQDHKRALLIGTTTFGKASVQSVIQLQDGSGLRLTTAKYYTPLGRGIHRDPKTGKGGILPDISLEIPKETEAGLQKQEAMEDVAAAKEHAFQIGVSTAHPAAPPRIEDIQLTRAIELLKARDILIRK